MLMKKWGTILLHVIVWVLLFSSALIFGASYLGFAFIHYKISTFLGIAIVLFYFNYSYLTPKYYNKKKFTLYWVLSLAVISIFSLSRYLIEENILVIQNPLDIQQSEFMVFFRYFIGCLYVFSLAFIFRNLADWQTQERERYKWQALKNETDLKYLKNQLRPHFLFNSINNIYAIAVNHNDQSAPMLLEISQMLRYLISKTEKDRIPIKEEVHFLNSLIKLYSLSFDSVPFDGITVEGSINKYEIPPLILLPFIENIFKHADFEQQEKLWLLHLGFNGGVLKFETQNPIRDDKDDNDKENKSGIGLLNLKKRLEILFPRSYSLESQIINNCYCVRLELNLNER